MTGLLHLFHRKKKNDMICSGVVVAAGSARRMNGVDKIMVPVGGLPVLAHSIRSFEECFPIKEIVVVTREDLIFEVGKLVKDCGFSKVSKIIVGGDSRAKSVLAGLNEVSPHIQLVAIHDGARPFLTGDVLEEVIRKGAECGAAAPGIPVKDTIKRARAGLVLETLERSDLFRIQTPQVFEAALIKAAILKALQDQVMLTDDCAAVERLGQSVAITRGSEENIKITTPDDLLLGEAILKGRKCP